MENLSKVTVKRGNDEYELSLAWDDAAFVEGQIKFGVRAIKRDIETREEKEPVSATVSIIPHPEFNPEEEAPPGPLLEIIVKNEKTGEEETIRYPLEEIFDKAQVIDLIPSYLFGGDPIIGCLIRSGLSSSIAEIISCKNKTAGIIPWFMRRMQALGKCLVHAAPDIASNMAKKSIKCILRFGF